MRGLKRGGIADVQIEVVVIIVVGCDAACTHSCLFHLDFSDI